MSSTLNATAFAVASFISSEGPKSRKEVFAKLGGDGTAQLAELAGAGILTVSEDEMPPKFSITELGHAALAAYAKATELLGSPPDEVDFHHRQEAPATLEEFRTMPMEQAPKISRDSQHNMYHRSGHFSSFDPLLAFLYSMLRNGTLSADQIERTMESLEEGAGGHRHFVNGWLAAYADDVVERLVRLAEKGQIAEYMMTNNVGEDAAREALGFTQQLIENASAKDVPEENLN